MASLEQEAAKVDMRVWSIHQPQRLLQAVLGLADSSLPDGAVFGYRVRVRGGGGGGGFVDNTLLFIQTSFRGSRRARNYPAIYIQ